MSGAQEHISSSVDGWTSDNHHALVEFRRHLHAAPEPSGEETRTSELIAESLEECGYTARVLEAGTGVLTELDLGADADSFIALRADLDCVCVPDEKTVPYRSKHDGLCHACGHDAHATMLLGVAQAFRVMRDAIASSESAPRHNLRFIFQPAEEIATGATMMIQSGALENVAAIFAMHVDPFIPAGAIGVRDEHLTALADCFTVRIKGRGGHSARPSESRDPVAAATSFIQQVYTFVPRSVDSRDAAVVNFSTIHAGDAFNAIPDECVITGTLRAINPIAATGAQQAMLNVAEGVSAATGCDIQFAVDVHCPATNNTPALNRYFEAAADEAGEPGSVMHIAQCSLGGEDFAFYQEHVPGAIIRLGAALNAGCEQPLHSSRFDIDESALGHGVRILARTALQAATTWDRRES